MAKGPYTIRRDILAKNYRWKAENIVRFFDKLGMTKQAKIKFLSEEFAQIHMNVEHTQSGIRMLERIKGGE